MSPTDKPLAWLHGEVKSPPFSKRRASKRDISCDDSNVGKRSLCLIRGRCQGLGRGATNFASMYEEETWRIVYRVDTDAIVIVEVFTKKTARTPKRTIDLCRKRLKEYDNA